MSKLYEVLSAESAWDAVIDADHTWGLPGVECPACSAWGRSGVYYPSIDLSDLPNQERYRDPWPVPLAEFLKLKTSLLRRLPDLKDLPPGTTFGPLHGTAKGEFGDFAWRDPWTLLLQHGTFKHLANSGLRLPKCVPAALTITDSNVQQLCELELEPLTQMDLAAFPFGLHQCQVCGRIKDEIPEPIVILRSSIPEHVDIFRDRLMTTIILAKQAFVEAVVRLELTGVVFREVETT
jgi:uncharacterized double-CXXCG motif protein